MSALKPPKMSDLVALMGEPQVDGSLYFFPKEVREISGVNIDLRAGAYTYEGATHRIGSHRRHLGSTVKESHEKLHGLIGVYDRKDTRHLAEMVNTVQVVTDTINDNKRKRGR